MNKLLPIALGMLMAVPAFAREFSYEYGEQTLWYTVLDEDAKTVEVRAENETEGDLIIPEIAKDGETEYTVTAIEEKAFYKCSGLTSVTIPNSVTIIGASAFGGCNGLTKAEFGSIESLCTIDFGNDNANPLHYAHNLYIDGDEIKDVVITTSVTTIGNYAFEGGSGLMSVTIPESVMSIGTYAFGDCSGLTSVTIPESVTSIGESAFWGCSSLTKAEFASIEALCSIDFGNSNSNPLGYAHNLYIDGKEIKDLVIPSTVSSIGAYAFQGCRGLTSVTIPESVMSIGYWAFSGCSGLTSVTIPESVTSIGGGAFEFCSGLTKAEYGSIESLCSIEFANPRANPLYYAGNLYINGEEIKELIIPTSVAAIGSCAFSSCRGLTSVTIPESVTSIGNWAFEDCRGLTSVTIPESVTSFGWHAFYECSSLMDVYYAAEEPIEGSSNIFSQYEATLHVPAVAVDLCKEIDPWKNFANIEAYDFNGVEEVAGDVDAALPYEVYSLSGVRVADSIDGLASGVYVLRQGGKSRKVVVE